MKFEWDEEKRRANIEKHGIDFMDACRMFSLPMLVVYDNTCDYGEDRWIGVGMMGNHIAVVVFTERGAEDDRTTRIISVRKALKHERENYESKILD
jgi:uncharacterized protein